MIFKLKNEKTVEFSLVNINSPLNGRNWGEWIFGVPPFPCLGDVFKEKDVNFHF